MEVALSPAERGRATWPRLLAVIATVVCASWFLVSFARREGGTLDSEQLYAAWFGARPARVALGTARIDTNGSRVLDLELDANAASAAAEPTRLVLLEAEEPGPVLGALGGFQRYEQFVPEEPRGDDAGEPGKGMPPQKPQWREIERGELAYGKWSSGYVRLRMTKRDEADRDQIRVNLSDKRRFAVLVAEWAPGVASAVEPLEKLLGELAVKAEIDPPAR